MENLVKLIKLNLRMLINSKKPLILLMLGPLLLVSLAVLAFDNVNTYNLTLGIYAESATDLGHAYIKTLKEQNFKVTRFKTQDSCIGSLKTGGIHACIVFKDGPKDEIVFYIDYSKINLVSDLENRMGYQVSKRAEELSNNLTQTLLMKLDATRLEIAENRKIIISLTTDNENIHKQIKQLSSHLTDLNFKIKFHVTDDALALSEDNFLEWITQLTSQSSEVIQEYRQLTTDIEDSLHTSAISETDKNEILQILSDGKEELRKLSDNLRISGDLTAADVKGLADLIEGVVSKLDELQEQLDSLTNFKHEGLSQLNDIQRSLDKNLIKYISIQNAFNNIENNIDEIGISDADDLSPIKTVIKPVVAVKTRFNYVFPMILVLIVMFTGIMLGSTLVVLDRESPAAFRNFMTPTKRSTFILSLFATSFIILLAQVIILLLIAAVFLGSQVLLSMHTFIISLSLIISVFALLGLVLGHIFKTEEAAIVSGVTVSSLLLVFSDLILPLESMPLYLANMFQFNPFVVSTSILKKILIFNLSIPYLLDNLVTLLCYAGALLLILYFVAYSGIDKKHNKF